MDQSIFGFPEFLTALALLVLVFTVGDARYRFRAAIAPVPLFRMALLSALAIGLATLLLDIWYGENWPTLVGPVGKAGLQALLGFLFLALVTVWLLLAYVAPLKFGRWNAKQYIRAVYRVVLKGSDSELAIIADEISSSANRIVRYCNEVSRHRENGRVGPSSIASDAAHDLLLLLGDRRFCRQVALTSPGTAIAIFSEMGAQKKYRLPVADFGRNVMSEAIANHDSLLHHETSDLSWNYLGYTKPFSRALLSNFELVEALAADGSSPLDIDLTVRWELDPRSYAAFGKALNILCEAYLNSTAYGVHSYAVCRAFHIFQNGISSTYRLNDADISDYYSRPEYNKLQTCIYTIKELVGIIEKSERRPLTPVPHGNTHHESTDFYDLIVDLMFEAVYEAASVRGDQTRVWSVQYGIVWSGFFTIYSGPVWSALRVRLRRRLFDEIEYMTHLPNYKGAAILGMLLNVMGVQEGNPRGHGREHYALRRVVLGWTRKNYMALREKLPDVADACLGGGISFDEEKRALVKTFAKGLERQPTQHFLRLD